VESTQYLELYNASALPIELLGLEISGSVSGSVTIPISYMIQPGEYALGQDISADPAACYDRTPDFVWSGWSMNQGYETLSVQNGTWVVDTVDMNLWFTRITRSMQLRPEFLNADLNDFEASWCVSENVLEPTCGRFGTPGEPNDCTTDTAALAQCVPVPFVHDTADTAGPPPDTALRFGAVSSGDAQYIPAAFFSGIYSIKVGTKYGPITVLSNPGQRTCWFDWEANAVGVVANPTSVCPTCSFGFEVEMTSSVDMRLQQQGIPSDQLECVRGFGEPLGPDRSLTFVYDPVEDVMLYENQGAWFPYTYDMNVDVGAGFQHFAFDRVVYEYIYP